MTVYTCEEGNNGTKLIGKEIKNKRESSMTVYWSVRKDKETKCFPMEDAKAKYRCGIRIDAWKGIKEDNTLDKKMRMKTYRSVTDYTSVRKDKRSKYVGTDHINNNKGAKLGN